MGKPSMAVRIRLSMRCGGVSRPSSFMQSLNSLAPARLWVIDESAKSHLGLRRSTGIPSLLTGTLFSACNTPLIYTLGFLPLAM